MAVHVFSRQGIIGKAFTCAKSRCRANRRLLHLIVFAFPVLSVLAMAFLINWTGGGPLHSRVDAFGQQIEASMVNPSGRDFCESSGLRVDDPQDHDQLPTIQAFVATHVSWQVTTAIFCFTCAAGSLVAIRIWLRFTPLWLYRIVSLGAILAVIAFFVYVIKEFGISESAVTTAILQSLFEFQLGSELCMGAVSAARMSEILYLIYILEAVAFHALFLAAFALIFSQGDPAATATSKAADLSLCAGQLRTLLFIGSAILFVGVANVETMFAWRAGLLPEHLQESALELGKALNLIWVAKWTMSLAILFCWPQAVFNRRADALYHSSEVNTGGITRKKWLEENGLQVGFGEWFVKILAILGPLLATSGIPTASLLP